MTKSVIPSNEDILSILLKGCRVNNQSNSEVFPFIPCPLLINTIEKIKRRGKQLPTEIISRLNQLSSLPLYPIELTPSGLYNAINDDEFVNKFFNKQNNPFIFSTEASIYGDECWGDHGELSESLKELTWI